MFLVSQFASLKFRDQLHRLPGAMTSRSRSRPRGTETCRICLGQLKVSVNLECGHRFHAECAVTWFRQGRSDCPLCRSSPTGGTNETISQLEHRITELEDENHQLDRENRELRRQSQRLQGLAAIELLDVSFGAILRAFTRRSNSEGGDSSEFSCEPWLQRMTLYDVLKGFLRKMFSK
jgi:hypothetical protein